MIIAVDVSHNSWVLFAFTLPLNPSLTVGQLWTFVAQVAFLIFVAATVRRAWGPRRSGALCDLEYVQAFVPRGIGDAER
jgi:hypothetical protein